jgi:hypothetical protein
VSLALNRIIEDVIGAAESNPEAAAEIYADAAMKFRQHALRRENFESRGLLAAKANEFEALGVSHVYRLPEQPTTVNDFDELEAEHAQAMREVGHLDDLEVRARRDRLQSVRTDKLRMSITPESITDKTALGRQITVKYAPTQADKLINITDADTVVLWQGSKTEAQAFSVDVGVVTSPAIGTQVSCRPYGIITYGSDGWQNSYRFDIGQGTRLTGVGNYCSVLVGMDAPGFGLPSGQMTLGAGLGTFAATSLAPVTLTSYVEGIRVVPDLNNNVDVVMPVKAKLLLPPQCSDVNTLTQIDFYDIAGNLLYSLQFLSGTIVSPIPLSNDFAYVKVTRLSTSSGPVYATYRLIWQLAL